ncbi:MAG: lysophospholipase [Muribaculaceae bacterium]|nr:lysophospholipase [Muribaculaceae bacterium]
MAVVLHFTETGDSIPNCTMDSPDQNARDIPAVVDFLAADSVKISIPKLMLSYAGHYCADSIVGIFQQGFVRIPLTMRPGDAVVNRPQTPVSPFPYSAEEVTFSNIADSAILCGTLLIPAEGTAVTENPVVIMVTGSGQQNRDEELLRHKPFLGIADYLARHGIATLRYDDRGAGSSTGDFATATSANFRNDARAGIEMLRNDGRFGKIGILGHSEGGLISYMLASAADVDFAVSLAGPPMRGDSLLLYQNMELLRTTVGDSVSDAYCTALADVFSYVAASDGLISKQTAKAEVDRILSEKGLALPSSLVDNLATVMVSTSQNPWLRYFTTYDPTDDIKNIDVPVMAVVGCLDRQVPSAPTVAALQNSLSSEGSIIKEYPGLNHMFQHAVTGMPDEYGKIEETISEEVLDDIVKFINSTIAK